MDEVKRFCDWLQTRIAAISHDRSHELLVATEDGNNLVWANAYEVYVKEVLNAD